MTTDVLGSAYTTQNIQLAPDDEGEVVATLVSRRAADPSRRAADPSRRAVLYLHGFADYFFQDHQAQFWVDEGYDFYALDLRKHGRSLRGHQTPNFCRDLAEYDEELDEASRIIADDGHETLVLAGHSTGGLIAALWAHRRPGVVTALVLNSPWFELNRSLFERTIVTRAVDLVGARHPYLVVEKGLPPHYVRSIHADHDGEWSFDLAWKPLTGFAIRAGWIRAIRRAHAQLAAGLNITCPVLVACSTRSVAPTRWSTEIFRADAVLDVTHMAMRAPRLGRHVTIVRIPDAVHDLALSGRTARTAFFRQLRSWSVAYVGPRNAPGAEEAM